MKKLLSFFGVTALALTLVSCGGVGTGGKQDEGEQAPSTATVALPRGSQERVLLEEAGALATRQYVIARLKTDALLEYDYANGSVEELQALVDDTALTWEVAEELAAQTEQLALDATAIVEEGGGVDTSAGADVTVSPPRPRGFSLIPEAHAAQDDAALKWATALTKQYDSFPAGQKIRTLAQGLGTDAKMAFAQLQMAQNILEGAAYTDLAKVEQEVEEKLMVVKTSCKTALYVGSIAAGGAPATALEVGGLILGGVDTLVDIASTGTTIVLGEGDSVTMAVNEVKDILAPITAVTGLTAFNSASAAKVAEAAAKGVREMSTWPDRISYVGDAVADLVYEGKILGGLITIGDDGQTIVTTTQIATEGKSAEQVASALETVGIPVPPAEAVAATPAEIASQMEDQFKVTDQFIEDYISRLREFLYEAYAQPPSSPATEEEDEETQEQTPNAPPSSDGLPLTLVVGTYQGTATTEYSGAQSASFAFTQSGGRLMFVPGSVDMTVALDYDPGTGTATGGFEMLDPEGTIYNDLTFKFRSEGGVVKVEGSWLTSAGDWSESSYWSGSKTG